MDNTPRAPIWDGTDTYGPIFWLDALAQQALSAHCIAGLAQATGRHELAERYTAIHAGLCEDLVQRHWNDALGVFTDRTDDEAFALTDVITPATFWPLLAGAGDQSHVDRVAVTVTDDALLGGTPPLVSVARNSPHFSALGSYWRGGMWAPTALVALTVLTQRGHADLAHRLAWQLVDHVQATYASFEPHTLWEAYSPTEPRPATAKSDDELVRPDFCGWSALFPITITIEHLVGIDVDGLTRTITWTRRVTGRHGLRRLACGPVTVDLVSDGEVVTVDTDGDVTLVLDGHTHRLAAGHHVLTAPGSS